MQSVELGVLIGFVVSFLFRLVFAMKIEELDDLENVRDDGFSGSQIVRVDAKRALVGAGARILFYPTLLYNVLRNKIEAEFRWWDEVDQVFLVNLFVLVFNQMIPILMIGLRFYRVWLLRKLKRC